MFDIFSSKTNDELEALTVRDIAKTIMEASKLMTKKNMSQIDQNKAAQFASVVASFKSYFEDILKQGLPSP